MKIVHECRASDEEIRIDFAVVDCKLPMKSRLIKQNVVIELATLKHNSASKLDADSAHLEALRCAGGDDRCSCLDDFLRAEQFLGSHHDALLFISRVSMWVVF